MKVIFHDVDKNGVWRDLGAAYSYYEGRFSDEVIIVQDVIWIKEENQCVALFTAGQIVEYEIDIFSFSYMEVY